MSTEQGAVRPDRDTLDLSAAVLVIGGGPAGAWAAVAAGEAGARVVLVDKGYLGTSGATAGPSPALRGLIASVTGRGACAPAPSCSRQEAARSASACWGRLS